MILAQKLAETLKIPCMVRTKSARQYIANEVEFMGSAASSNAPLFGIIVTRNDGVKMIIVWDQIESIENCQAEQVVAGANEQLTELKLQ